MRKTFIGSMLLVLLLVLAACGGGKSAEGGEIFTYGAQTYSDPKIMGDMVKLLIEDQTDHEVEIKSDIQASPQILGALDQGELDFATMYTGEVYNNHFDDDKVEFSTDPVKTLEQAQELFGEKYDMKWYDPIGFTNQYSITIDKDFAEENGIETMSDLGEYAPEMKMGADSAWKERANDGYEDFKEAYEYEFESVAGMEISLMYEGIAGGDLDVITAYTVDPHILENNLVTLEDDREFFSPYQGSLVAKNEILEEYPEVAEVLDSLVDKVSTEDMTELIREVDINQRDINEVAKEYLEEIGMLD